MPDLLAHTAVARLVVLPARDPVRVLLVLFGSVLPDLASKTIEMFVVSPIYTAIPSHSLPGTFLQAFAISFFFSESIRPAAFRDILLGEILHVALDLLKTSATVGYLFLYPFTTRGFEAGLIHSEDSVYLAPLFLLILLLPWRTRDAR